MKRIVPVLGIICVTVVLFFSTIGCNTIEGMGEDLEATGEAIEQEAEE
ncbi:entericidin A/B family lipoprotein [Desulfohalobium retbaense]|uniref:Entericidin EcnAB n=1 Tax=Desulfohalobium retbaense (strain ATCC 49708 / DSM 5692 / JCM 16813 / HR100) TaxID=485915 RepID=C8X013_DESRD|nr:entericidin A/B family lipoprotein [Desulfohalobium retbaense]ACV67638.1 Entericidin EcnAB [Desulfohalobium retbaense DSM 5692]